MKLILLLIHCRTNSGQVREHCTGAQAHTAHCSRGNACSKAVHATDLCCCSLRVQESSSYAAFHTGIDSALDQVTQLWVVHHFVGVGPAEIYASGDLMKGRKTLREER